MDISAQLIHTSGMPRAAVQHRLVQQLREDLAYRRIERGLRALEDHRSLFDSIRPDEPASAVLLSYIAQWVDVGFDSVSVVEELLSRFPAECRTHLTLIEYLHLRVAEGFTAMSRENFERAIEYLKLIGTVEDELRDNELVVITNFWIGRCLRRTGRYDDALEYTTKARDAALARGFAGLAAIAQITESWLHFQKGRTADAHKILGDAAVALSDTDDYVARGNIESAYGRIARRQGRYDRAIYHFDAAIQAYKHRDPQHPNVARSLVNLAFVKRLIALQVQRKIDADVATRNLVSGNDMSASARLPQERGWLESLRTEAHRELDQAGAIYTHTDNHRGCGTVHLNRGFLHLDHGDLDLAFTEASQAFLVGEGKFDYILMARARILQAIIENTRFEEQIEDTLDPMSHAQRAHDFAGDAVEFARHTQNRRLLARAQVWRGLTFANDLLKNVDAARECCDAAMALLKPDVQDYIWDDLQQLRRIILRKGPVDTALREWSQGLVGEKSFQQITEEFAAIVIPRVWEREQRKVSRVAQKLSISPKKVRRILQASGVLDHKAGAVAGGE